MILFRSETYERVWMKFLSFTLYIWRISCGSKINLHRLQFCNLILYDVIWSGYCKHIRSNCSNCTARWVSRPDGSVGSLNRCNATRKLCIDSKTQCMGLSVFCILSVSLVLYVFLPYLSVCFSVCCPSVWRQYQASDFCFSLTHILWEISYLNISSFTIELSITSYYVTAEMDLEIRNFYNLYEVPFYVENYTHTHVYTY